ncbi:MAG: hypothetical protein JJD97_13775 [Gemmatimonadaceae bacterium]|nr:hypothetical protein [Gemmatimonadaceae bacterium]
MIHPEVEVARSSVLSADAPSAPKYVAIVGEEPTSSAPSLTLAKALNRLGVDVRFAPANDLQRPEWIKLLRSAQAVLLVSYGELNGYLVSQLATAVAMNVPIVRWWVGTDVLNAISRSEIRQNATRIDDIVAENVAVAPHLVEELATIGIRARYVPSVIETDLADVRVAEWTGVVKPVLVYLPGRRKEFYGLGEIETVIAANPDLEFLVVADETHALSGYSNVQSLGWVSDMRRLYHHAGCVLRITKHDWLPRMLIEAMLRGLYAIYSWPLPGTWEAHTSDDIHSALAR